MVLLSWTVLRRYTPEVGITRRFFVKGTGLLSYAAALAACSNTNTSTEEPTATADAASTT
jgi:hypothetical protein